MSKEVLTRRRNCGGGGEGGGGALPEADDADTFVAIDHVHAGGIVLKQKKLTYS